MRIFILLLGLVLAGGAGADTRYVAAHSGAAVISGPGTVYDTVDRLGFGSAVDVREVYEGYALILMRSGVEAWVDASALSRSRPAPKVRVTELEPYAAVVWTKDSPLNMRTGPSLTAAIKGQCLKGDWVEVFAMAGSDWAHVRLPNGHEGWVAARYLTR